MGFENFSSQVVFSKTPKESWHPNTDGPLVFLRASAYAVAVEFQHIRLVQNAGIFQPSHKKMLVVSAELGVPPVLKATEFEAKQVTAKGMRNSISEF